MTKHVLTLPRTIFAGSVWMLAVFIICASFATSVKGQRQIGPYADVKKWYGVFDIVVTSGGGHDITDPDTSGGNHTIHYSVYHEYKGAFSVTGPERFPIGLPGRDDGFDPAWKLDEVVDWVLERTKEDKLYCRVTVRDDFEDHSTGLAGEGNYELHDDNEYHYTFDADVPTPDGLALVAIHLKSDSFVAAFDLIPNVLSWEKRGDVKVVHTLVHKSDDPNDASENKNDSNVSTIPLLTYEYFRSNSLVPRRVQAKGSVTGTADEIEVCRNEKLTEMGTRLPGFSVAIGRDMVEKNTTEVQIKLRISRKPIPDVKCK